MDAAVGTLRQHSIGRAPRLFSRWRNGRSSVYRHRPDREHKPADLRLALLFNHSPRRPPARVSYARARGGKPPGRAARAQGCRDCTPAVSAVRSSDRRSPAWLRAYCARKAWRRRPSGVRELPGGIPAKNVTSSLGLQQTLIIITLLAQYTDPSSAHINVQNVSGQNLNQLFLGGSLNGFSSEAATVPPIEDDSSALHFSGDTNGTSIGEQSPAPNSGSTEESVDFTGLPASLTVYGTSGSFQSSQQARHWLARTHPRGAWTACISWTAVRARCRIG